MSEIEELWSESSVTDFDSGWVADDNSSNHVTEFTHALGVIPTQLEIWFAPILDAGEATEIYPLKWSWNLNTSGNPVSISADNNTIRMYIYSGAPFHGYWNATSWRKYNSGFWQVIARP